MSFRNRLYLFFVLIVVVPMLSVALVLFRLIGDSDEGKQEQRTNSRQSAIVGLVQAARDRADRAAVRVGTDPVIAEALRSGDRAALRVRAERFLDPNGIKRIRISSGGETVVDVGGENAVFPASRELQAADGRSFGLLQVSVQGPRDLLRATARVAENADVVIVRGREVLAATRPELARPDLPLRGRVEIAEREYRAFAGRPERSFGSERVRFWVLDRVLPRSDDYREGTRIAALVMGGFFLMALIFAMLVSRSLQRQIHGFLHAARRLARLDFDAAVPTVGRDEFAELGTEFNSMAAELKSKIEALDESRRRLRMALRRTGETFAANLDRDALLEIVVETSVDGLAADLGRAVARANGGAPMREVVTHGAADDGLLEAVGAAEARVLEVGEAAELELDGIHAVAQPLRGGDAPDGLAGILTVAARGRRFDEDDRELLEYLAAQAAVSLENVGLHEKVERQAVTDQLTSLFNRRRFDETLADEAERARRFGTPVSLLLLDIDNFKAVNDTYGHQVGDDVLREVARVLRESVREIDEPARYGGEELAAVLPGTDLEGAYNLAERVRAGIAKLRLPLPGTRRKLRVTASFGVAELPASADDPSGLLARADGALYEAKRAGKNRVERAETPVG